MHNNKIIILLIPLIFFSFAFAGEKHDNRLSFNKVMVEGLLDTMQINNIYLPYQNDGSTADDAQAFFPNGTNLSFLFQGGIAASGFVNGELRCSWMAKASLIQEFQPGNWGTDPLDAISKFYVVTPNDAPGGDSYVDWQGAVSLGASFQDVDGDGFYNPDIDRPDILGDRTSFCVYNDGTGEDIRSQGLLTDAMGLEILQTVFAFAFEDELGNVVFFRYRFVNKGDDDIDDLIFSIWADPDIGAAEDDLIGSDTTLSLGYIYNDGEDANYGSNPPAFGVDFFQGPIVESPGDTAFLFMGPWFGIDTVYDHRNLPMTSFVFYNNANDPDPFASPRENPERARDYQEGGKNGLGEPIDPTVFGVGGTANDNPLFFYTGDPEAETGWRDVESKDKRFLVNTGPFQLPRWQDSNGNQRPDLDEPGVQDIVVAYVVGRGTNATNSVTVLKEVDQVAQAAYNSNFIVAGPPPPPEITVRTYDQEIEFIIDLDKNDTFYYDKVDSLDNRQVFEGVKIYQFASPSTNEFEGGLRNKTLLTSFDLTNQYKNIYRRSGNQQVRIYDGKNNFIVGEGQSPIIRYTVKKDEFATEPPGLLINNVEYFFAVSAFSINYQKLDSIGVGEWVGPSTGLLENNLSALLIRTIPGSDENNPTVSVEIDTAQYTGLRRKFDGQVLLDAVYPEQFSGDVFSVRFFDNGEYWQVLNNTQNDLVIEDSLAFQDTLGGNSWTFPIVDGISVRVQDARNALSAVQVATDTTETDTPVVWLKGNLGSGYGSSALFDGGISLAIVEKPDLSNILKQEYFQVRVEIDTTLQESGYLFIGNWLLARGPSPIPLRAFDISDPNNERQVNVCYRGLPSGDLNFVNNEIMIMKSDYDPQNAYPSSGPPDDTFKEDAFVIMNLAVVSDTIPKTPLEFEIMPYLPNSDLDIFSFSSQDVTRVKTPQELEAQLDAVQIVPNPYWAFSLYETSYDTPVLKFTRLPRNVTIRIFDLAGNLVKILTKNDDTNNITWNLRNEASLKIASGMYIAHIEAPNIGSKVMKFAVIQREERLDRY